MRVPISYGVEGERNGSRLLAILHPDDRALVEPHLERRSLRRGETVLGVPDIHRRICFPESAVFSYGEVMEGARAEIGLVGSEGMIGWSVLLGATTMPFSGMVQMRGGSALFGDVEMMVRACAASPRLQATLLRFVQTFTEQMAGTLMAALRDSVEQRLARWLLMLHDRLAGDVLQVTHGELAGALHVRRASVTDCLHLLEGNGVVRCSRGQLVIRDRAALEGVAGRSYGAPETSYRRLFEPDARRSTA